MSRARTKEGGLPAEDRVRAVSPAAANARVDQQLEYRIRFFATQDRGAISARLAELDREWDIERAIAVNAGTIGLSGILLSMVAGRKWLVLPVAVTGFLLQHGLQGWCPPVPVLRRLGFRTRMEIEQERYALKVLRGDFDGIAEARDPEEIVTSIQE